MDSDKGKELREKLIADLRAAERSRLTERERMLVDSVLAHVDGDDQRQVAIVEAYLAEHPHDPWALMILANAAWARQDWTAAEARYRLLLEVDPNWLQARNHLGYIAMAQGRFAEAEEHFRIYRFVAPDQANPHDSLGELLVLLGRYEEARRELEAGLAIRPDFCASYGNLMRAAVLDRKPEELDAIVARAAGNCPASQAAELRCTALLSAALLGGDYGAPWSDPKGACADRLDQPQPILHELAVLSGRRAEALAIEAKVTEWLAEAEAKAPLRVRGLRSLLGLMEGFRLGHEGRAEEAAAKLRVVEEAASYWEGNGGGVLKLLARGFLVDALAAQGDAAGAARALDRLREVNPSFAAWFDPAEARTRPIAPPATAPAVGVTSR
jgi:Flp pilus assembly protein TadD